MTSDRLSHLQSNLELYYQQLAGKENALRTIEPSEKVRIRQQIDELLPEIATAEREYWNFLKVKGSQILIADADAEVINGEILEEVELLQLNPAIDRNAELMKLLQEIKAELTKPEILGSAKLKAAIHIIPGFLSYEVEVDTEGVLRRFFPIFSKLGDMRKKL